MNKKPGKSRPYFWEGKKIRLRALRADDWKSHCEGCTDTENRRLLQYGVELPTSPTMAQKFIEEWADFKDTGHRIMFSIETLSGQWVGGINLHTMDQKNGTCGFGITVVRPFQGKGYGAEALRLLLRYAFRELRFQKANGACIEGNIGSIMLHKAVGFVEEGRRRRSIYTNGQYYDEFLFGLTAEEFEENDRKAGR
jgi:RimJ/RimL family protein N-acetyltransferase